MGPVHLPCGLDRGAVIEVQWRSQTDRGRKEDQIEYYNCQNQETRIFSRLKVHAGVWQELESGQ